MTTDRGLSALVAAIHEAQHRGPSGHGCDPAYRHGKDAAAILAAMPDWTLVPSDELDTIEHLSDANERLDAAAHAAYEAMDAATRWAAHQRPEADTSAALDEHLKGYDALLDGQVRLGQALGILHRAALADEACDQQPERDWTEGHEALADALRGAWEMTGRSDPLDGDQEAWQGFALIVKAKLDSYARAALRAALAESPR